MNSSTGKKVAFHTLGCKVNQYETEAIKSIFASKGWLLVEESDTADAYVINTCTVTGLADRKSRQYIRKMKKKNPDAVVVVTGCYAQVSKEEVMAIEGVNLVVGNNKKNEIVPMVERYISENKTSVISCVIDTDKIDEFEEWGSVAVSENRKRAYVKIQEGCNRYCTYCIIPYARGKLRSRKEEDILNECKYLVSRGFKELILTGINTALYEDLESLLSKLDSMDGEFRIRLSSLEPTVINDEYVKKILKFQRLCHHLHLSVQSGSDRVLKNMNRRYDMEEYKKIVNTLRKFDYLYGITTDVIVGFPMESDEDFRETMENVKDIGFCRIHAFKYSIRKGTPAAEMKNQIPEHIKKDRSNKLIKLGDDIARHFVEKNIDSQNTVLFEEYSEEHEAVTGYTDNYIKAYLKCSKEEATKYEGELIDIRITSEFADGALVVLR